MTYIKAAVGLAFACACLAQSVMLQPIPRSISDGALGADASQDIGIWLVTVKIPAGAPTKTRVDIAMAVPQVVAIPNDEAEVILNRRAFADKRSGWARLGQGTAKLAPSGVTMGGWVAGSKEAVIAGLALQGLALAVPSLQAKAPDLARFKASRLLPENVALGSGTWYVVGPLGPDPKPIGPVPIL